MSLPGSLRAALLALLAAALLLPDREDAPRRAPGAVRLPERGFQAARSDSLLAGTPAALVVRSGEDPPGAAELDVLSAVAERSPLLVRLPEGRWLVRAGAPQRPVAGRAAAIPFRVHTVSGDSLWVRLGDGAGALDSLRVAPGPGGVAEGAFRVRPPREGWREWTVEVGGRQARTGAWVAPGREPRVLVVAGPPSWEVKFTVRALEESGATVELSQPLGRGLAVRQGEGGVPAEVARLARFDAVLLLDGAEPAAAQRSALADYVVRRGGGVLLAGGGGGPGALRVTAGGGVDAEVAGDRIRWTLPAEMAPLPPGGARTAAIPLGRPVPGAWTAARSAEGTLLALRTAGRGRVAALGLGESWRWRMEAGRIAEHREFWRSLVDWLASAPRDTLLVEVAEPVGIPGVPVEVRVFTRTGSGEPRRFAPDERLPELSLARPGGSPERLPLRPDPERPGVLRTVFVPAAPGVYSLATGGVPLAGFRADTAPGDAADPWARLALLAARSGGDAVPAEDFGSAVRRREAALGSPERRALPLHLLLLGLAAALAVTEWSVRRLRGRA
ncbi:MAG TPA: hypothetical protein VHG28_02575 [Longimicrobiaceae bacterium]|nr:hypothetical protein [Longimicrobiaceae bacterium]